MPFFNFLQRFILKFEWNDNRFQRIFWKNKIWKTVKVVGKFLPSENEVFGVCDHTPVACPPFISPYLKTNSIAMILKYKTKIHEFEMDFLQKLQQELESWQATGLYIQTLKLCFLLVGVSYDPCKFYQRLFFQNVLWNLLSFHSNFKAKKIKRTTAAVALFFSNIKKF